MVEKLIVGEKYHSLPDGERCSIIIAADLAKTFLVLQLT